MADLVSHSALMSWMTEELEKNKFQPEAGEENEPDDAFPGAR